MCVCVCARAWVVSTSTEKSCTREFITHTHTHVQTHAHHTHTNTHLVSTTLNRFNINGYGFSGKIGWENSALRAELSVCFNPCACVYDVWCVMCEVWGVRCEVWCVRCDVWCMMCEVWCMMYDVWCVCAGMRVCVYVVCQTNARTVRIKRVSVWSARITCVWCVCVLCNMWYAMCVCAYQDSLTCVALNIYPQY